MSESITDKIAADYLADRTQETSFQDRVHPWMLACFGPVISADAQERNHRFLEESLELVSLPDQYSPLLPFEFSPV